MTWLVGLNGDPADLDLVARSLADADVKVRREDEQYFLVLSKFGDHENESSVREEAKQIIERLSGWARVELQISKPIRFRNVVIRESNGKKYVVVTPEPAEARAGAVPGAVTITHPDGSVTNKGFSAGSGQAWMELAERDEVVGRVLGTLGAGSLDWSTLYKVIELIREDCGGEGNFVSRPWCSRREYELFKRTANSPGAIGKDARHGVEKTEPPKKPMTLVEAQAFVRKVVRAWVLAKLGRHGPA
jgi:hypothetical protein